MGILDSIHSPDDVKKLTFSELTPLCSEIRQRLIYSISKTGGHLSPNLGVVELTVAIHRVFDTFTDRLVFDVGHQGYVHKLLTGRNESFDTLRTIDGLSGFPTPDESVHDAFIAGHASNAISVALGMARARSLSGDDYDIVAFVGDGALTGGLSYEALSDLGQSGEPMVVILNDNGMSITRNVGGIARHLADLRMRKPYFSLKKNYRKVMARLPGGKRIYRFTHNIKLALKNALLHCSMFEDMGLEYLGPVDGYDLERLVYVLKWARGLKKPVIVHVRTIKGKGASYAERDPDLYHGVGRFDPVTGEVYNGEKSFSEVFGESLCALAADEKNLCAITAAMQDGTGLSDFAAQYKDRFFDVGIAEGHAASMCAGLAIQGMTPVFAVYSTFLQRSFDMLLHDIAIQNLHVILAVDRAGLCGADGVTHQGVFDVGFLSETPGMTVLAPASFAELQSLLRYAVCELRGPVAIRYPKGCEGDYKTDSGPEPKVLREGSDITILTYGTSINDVLEAAEGLEARGISAEVVKLTVIAPLDISLIKASVQKTGRLLVYELCAEPGCVGQGILAELTAAGLAPKRARLQNLGGGLVPHGEVAELKRRLDMDSAGIVDAALEIME